MAVMCGTRTRYLMGCRCVLCREANVAYRRHWRAEVRQELEPDDVRHGTLNGYTNYGCKCDRCRAANAAKSRRARQLARAAGEGS